MVVPLGWEAAEVSAASPPSTTTLVAAPSPVEVVREKEETLAIEGSASPLNPRVLTASISSTFRILLVACLSTESPASSGDIPEPSSRTRMREVPPSPSSTSMREAPASRAFSTSSLTTEAGRSTTSPAATCWATLGSSTLMLARGVCMDLHCIVHPGAGFPTGRRVESLTMPEIDENRPLPLREVEQLVELLRESGVGEIRVRRGETEISVKAKPEAPVAQQAAPVSQGVPEMVEPETSPEMDGLHAVRSPVVGTFYRAPAPGEGAYVEVGDAVSAGQTLCIVEAMKLMNEIVADVSGEVVEVLAEDAGGVEYDQPLFYLRPEAG